MRLFLCFIILFWSTNSAISQEISWDAALKKTEKNYRLKSSAKIAKQLTEGINNDSLKNILIYYWISNHVKYDTRKLNKNKISTSKVSSVLRRRRTQDYGFSILYQKMLLHAGIESEIIPGHLRNTNAQKTDLYYRDFYTYNAVKINDKWQLVDITWASGHLIKKQRKFRSFLFNFFGIPYIKYKYRYVQKRDPSEFLADPESFGKTHFPIDAMWQLLDYPKGIKYFELIDTLAKDSLQKFYNYEDSINHYISNVKSKKNLQYAKNSNDINKKNHQTKAKNLKEYLNNNYIEINNSSNLSLKQKLDSLKHTNSKHVQALEEYKLARKMIKVEYDYLNKRNNDRKNRITGENKKLIAQEEKLIKKDKSLLSKAKAEIKKTKKDTKRDLEVMNKMLAMSFRQPRKEKSPSKQIQEESAAGLEKIKYNRVRLQKIKYLCDSIKIHSDTLTLKFLKLEHFLIDSLYAKSTELTNQNKSMGIEYDYSIQDSLYNNRDTVHKCHLLRLKVRDSTARTEKSLVTESLRTLKKLTSEAKELIKQNKKLAYNAAKYLSYYDNSESEFDSLNLLLEDLYQDLFEMYELKSNSLKEDQLFYKNEIEKASFQIKRYQQENSIEYKRYSYEDKIFLKQENRLNKNNSIERDNVRKSKKKYAIKIKELETLVKNSKAPKQRS